ncbi:diaminopropionate ammonia-lyase [Fusarium oxysporum f. sp. conglutinans race 2 54008]|uniref:Diaminopropionate ammonia-lyase n=1 Tax=Fusarium oxysporum f. sp. conglutinans race 2 54008 TaxID=1089457 RepID=X0H8L9_FUSOX|nr:diaminopropionate ammonia-lyase [Fusarium oxysporum f. sp. conglutinans race 2 54008]
MMKDLGAIVARVARMNGWRFVSSTSWSEFDNSIVQNVRNAYMVVVEEALQVILAVENIMHAFVCGGVGSIAAAVFHGFFTRFCRI